MCKCHICNSYIFKFTLQFYYECFNLYPLWWHMWAKFQMICFCPSNSRPTVAQLNKTLQISLKIFRCIVYFMLYGLAAAFNNIFLIRTRSSPPRSRGNCNDKCSACCQIPVQHRFSHQKNSAGPCQWLVSSTILACRDFFPFLFFSKYISLVYLQVWCPLHPAETQ